MPTYVQPAPALIVGAALGAVIRYVVYENWSGPTEILVSTAVVTIAASLISGVVLGLGAGRLQAFVLGVAGGTASLSMYAVLGITAKSVPLGVLFLIGVPILSAVAATLGMLPVAWRRHTVEDDTAT